MKQTRLVSLKIHSLTVAVLGLVASLGSACLGAPPATQPSDFVLTIYSSADPATFNPQQAAQTAIEADRPARLPGYGVVREVRKIDLNAGVNTVRFADVAAGIDPTTVAFKSLSAPQVTAVLEQNYEYDLTSPEKLLRKYIGRDILINRKPAPGAPEDRNRGPDTREGVLLAYDGQQFVLQTKNRQMPVEVIPRSADISEIKLFNLDTGLITKPTLVWKIRTEAAGAHDVQVAYQTDGLTWRADYNLLVNKDDSAVDLSAWVSILNMSGAAYPNAKLKLVAGDVQRLAPRDGEILLDRAEAGGAKEAFTQKPLFEYHLYTLSRPTDLANNSTKQIELFPTRSNVAATKVFVYRGSPLPEQPRPLGSPAIVEPDFGRGEKKTVDVYLKLANSEKAGLGIPLPAGRVRMYKTDEADGAPEFVGEDFIRHTPKDEQVSVRVGGAFDIVGDRKQTDFTADINAKTMTETYKITLRNHKQQAIKVLVKEPMLRAAQWQITQKSGDFEKLSATEVQWAVELPANGEKTVTYTVKYTW